MPRLLSTLAGWGRSFASLFTIPRMGIIGQWALVTAFFLSLAIAYRGWDTGVRNWKADATLRYLDKLNDREYVDYLWDLEAFTLCFENAYKTPEQETKGRHISYVKYKDVRDIEANKELARRWWDYIENDSVEHRECGKPKDIGRKLMVVYGRIEALASCVAAGICDRNRIYDFENKRGMIEAFDYLTILSISNYMLLASKVMKNGQSVSRGWSTFGQFETLVTDIERYVFDAQPVLTPSQRQELWDKRTRCHPPQDAEEAQRDWYKRNDWRSCGTLQKEGASKHSSGNEFS
jgi:hypothetical protein